MSTASVYHANLVNIGPNMQGKQLTLLRIDRKYNGMKGSNRSVYESCRCSRTAHPVRLEEEYARYHQGVVQVA